MSFELETFVHGTFPNCVIFSRFLHTHKRTLPVFPITETSRVEKQKKYRDLNDDKPWTKEEQLLGYSTIQRQRMKALHTLGLTEEGFEKCRTVILASLGPSAFGFGVEETAAAVARAAEGGDNWTPGDRLDRSRRRKQDWNARRGSGSGGHYVWAASPFGSHYA